LNHIFFCSINLKVTVREQYESSKAGRIFASSTRADSVLKLKSKKEDVH